MNNYIETWIFHQIIKLKYSTYGMNLIIGIIKINPVSKMYAQNRDIML